MDGAGGKKNRYEELVRTNRHGRLQLDHRLQMATDLALENRRLREELTELIRSVRETGILPARCTVTVQCRNCFGLITLERPPRTPSVLKAAIRAHQKHHCARCGEDTCIALGRILAFNRSGFLIPDWPPRPHCGPPRRQPI